MKSKHLILARSSVEVSNLPKNLKDVENRSPKQKNLSQKTSPYASPRRQMSDLPIKVLRKRKKNKIQADLE